MATGENAQAQATSHSRRKASLRGAISKRPSRHESQRPGGNATAPRTRSVRSTSGQSRVRRRYKPLVTEELTIPEDLSSFVPAPPIPFPPPLIPAPAPLIQSPAPPAGYGEAVQIPAPSAELFNYGIEGMNLEMARPQPDNPYLSQGSFDFHLPNTMGNQVVAPQMDTSMSMSMPQYNNLSPYQRAGPAWNPYASHVEAAPATFTAPMQYGNPNYTMYTTGPLTTEPLMTVPLTPAPWMTEPLTTEPLTTGPLMTGNPLASYPTFAPQEQAAAAEYLAPDPMCLAEGGNLFKGHQVSRKTIFINISFCDTRR